MIKIHQCHRVVDTVASSLELGQYCTAAFLDVEQAFDRVWHEGLLSKLKGILPSIYIIILKFYLSNRHLTPCPLSIPCVQAPPRAASCIQSTVNIPTPHSAIFSHSTISASSLPTLILTKQLNLPKTTSKSLKTGSRNGGSKLMRRIALSLPSH